MDQGGKSTNGAPPTNGVHRCPKCGASETRVDGAWLVCTFCRFRWNTTLFQSGPDGDIALLDDVVVYEGAKDIDTSALVTMTCSGCGASVGINATVTLRAHCHWCRHELALNRPVGNGAVPDAILPFAISRDDAMQRMIAFVHQLSEFADPAFARDFSASAISAVYLPYLIADGKVTVRLDGEGWVDQGYTSYGKTTIYHTDRYRVMREAELDVDNLVIEARSTRTRLYAAVSTSNIINAIQPFDVTHAVAFDARYIADGTTFEARDMEVSTAMSYAADHFATMARGYVNQTLTGYTAGVRWDAEQCAVKGSRWASVLLPVWLYAFTENTTQGPMMHYIAVNGRTGETQGSVPMDRGKAARSAWLAGLAVAAAGLPFVIIGVAMWLASAAGQ